MRDRLIESVKPFVSGSACEQESGVCEFTDCRTCNARALADHLLANGVIVPPCKVGQMVYVLRSKTSNGKNLYLREERISHYRIFSERSFMCFESDRISVSSDNWSTTVFLTKEEAEKALAERRGK